MITAQSNVDPDTFLSLTFSIDPEEIVCDRNHNVFLGLVVLNQCSIQLIIQDYIHKEIVSTLAHIQNRTRILLSKLMI